MMEFLAMGGYAGYVWSAFGLTALVMAANLVLARRRHMAMLERLGRRFAGTGAGS